MRLAAVLVVGAAAWLAYKPGATTDEVRALARRFAFTKSVLPGPTGVARRPLFSAEYRHFEPYLESFLPVGAALADIDGTGLPNQACIADPFTGEVWVHALPGKAEPFPSFRLDLAAVVPDPRQALPTGCLPGDFDEDGRTDLLVYFWGRAPVAFLQRDHAGPLSAAAFRPVELVPHGDRERWYTQSITSADVDGDGHLDLVVANYFPAGAQVLDDGGHGVATMHKGWGGAQNGGYNLLFLKDRSGPDQGAGGALFRAVPAAFGDDLGGAQWTIAVGAVDLDGDQLPEIMFVNDHGPDRLLHNLSTPGSPRFAMVRNQRSFLAPKSQTLGLDSFHGMGIAFGDLLGRGMIDMVVSNFTSSYFIQQSQNIWVNDGDPRALGEGRAPFVDRSEELGLAHTDGVPWDVRLADFDNGGELEVFESTGFRRGSVDRRDELHEMALMNDLLVQFPSSWHRFDEGDDLAGRSANAFFVRRPGAGFVDIGDALGMREAGVSRGAAVADTTGRGLVDLLVAHHHAPPSFYRNVAPSPGRGLTLDVRLPYQPADPARILVVPGPTPTRGGPPSRPAVGAAVLVDLPAGGHVAAVVDGGSGFGGKDAPQIHIGLGQAEAQPVRVHVAWRDAHGQRQSGEFTVAPGFHTVWLGTAAALAAADRVPPARPTGEGGP